MSSEIDRLIEKRKKAQANGEYHPSGGSPSYAEEKSQFVVTSNGNYWLSGDTAVNADTGATWQNPDRSKLDLSSPIFRNQDLFEKNKDRWAADTSYNDVQYMRNLLRLSQGMTPSTYPHDAKDMTVAQQRRWAQNIEKYGAQAEESSFNDVEYMRNVLRMSQGLEPSRNLTAEKEGTQTLAQLRRAAEERQKNEEIRQKYAGMSIEDVEAEREEKNPAWKFDGINRLFASIGRFANAGTAAAGGITTTPDVDSEPWDVLYYEYDKDGNTTPVTYESLISRKHLENVQGMLGQSAQGQQTSADIDAYVAFDRAWTRYEMARNDNQSGTQYDWEAMEAEVKDLSRKAFGKEVKTFSEGTEDEVWDNKNALEDEALGKISNSFKGLGITNVSAENMVDYVNAMADKAESEKLSAQRQGQWLGAGARFLMAAPMQAGEYVGNLIDASKKNPLLPGGNIYNDYFTQLAEDSIQAGSSAAASVGQWIGGDVLGSEKLGNVMGLLSSAAYSGVLSGIQSTATMGVLAALLPETLPFAAETTVGQAIGQAMLAMQSAGSTYRQAIQNGKTVQGATISSFTAGINEALFEGLSFGNLPRLKRWLESGGNLGKQLAVYGIQTAIEGSEEVFTDIGNFIADEIANADLSDYNQSVQKYIALGYTREQAEATANKDFLLQLVESGLGGMFGGATNATGVVAIANEARKTANRNNLVRSVANAVVRGDNVNRWVEDAESLPDIEQNAQIKQLAEQVKGLDLTTKSGQRQAAKLIRQGYKTIDSAANEEYYKANPEAKAAEDARLENRAAAEYAEKQGYKVTSGTDGADVVSIEHVAKEGDSIIATYKLADGTTITSDKIKFRNAEEAILWGEAARITGNAEQANAIVQSYAAMKGEVSPVAYIRAAQEAYRYGYAGYTLEEAKASGSFFSQLTKNVGEELMSLGQRQAQTLREKQGKVVPVTAGVKFVNSQGQEVDYAPAGLSRRQQATVEYMQAFSEKFGGQYVFFASQTKKGTARYTTDVGSEKAGSAAQNAFYDPKTGKIYVDLNAGGASVQTSLWSVAHEMTHKLKTSSPAQYMKLFDAVMSAYRTVNGADANRLADRISQAYKAAGYSLTEEDALEEVLCEAMADMLLSEHVNEMFDEISKADRKLGEQVKQFFRDMLAKIKEFFNGYSGSTEESRLLRQAALEDIRRIEDLWTYGVATMNEGAEETATTAETAAEKREAAGVDIDGETVVLQLRQYEETGRDALYNYYAKQYGKANAEDMMTTIDGIHDMLRQMESEHPELEVFSRWSNTEILLDENGKPIFTTSIKNGDYKLNQDFSRVCKKRRQLDFVLNMLAEDENFRAEYLTKKDFVKINKAIKARGFEIACGLCFVDSKRFRQSEWADTFANTWNDILRSVMVRDSHPTTFNFATAKPNVGDEGIQIDMNAPVSFRKWEDGRVKETRKYKNLADLIEHEGNNQVKAMARLIRDNGNMRHWFRGADIIASQGFDRIQKMAPDIRRQLDGWGGTSVPKPSSMDASYDNSILNIAGYNKATAFAMGGVRMNSFSDFMAHMFFDYCQAIQDLSAKGLPMQSYTKELIFARLYGLTGGKINLSGIPAIREDALPMIKNAKGLSDKQAKANTERERMFAGLDISRILEKTGKTAQTLTAKDITANLDLAEYLWADESIDIEKATLLQTGILYDKLSEDQRRQCYDAIRAGDVEKALGIAGEENVNREYAKHVGIIAVGVSDAHILKLLRDPTIRMVIPYHKSGLNHEIAIAMKIAAYNDYTAYQNTRIKIKGKSGKPGGINGKTMQDAYGIKDFNFYDFFGKEIDGVFYDGKATAAKYLEWCEKGEYDAELGEWVYRTKNGYITADELHKTAQIVPKFDRFAAEENYYKLLEDFDVYDTITGEHSPQEAVKGLEMLPSDYKAVLLNKEDPASLVGEQKTHDRFRTALNNEGLRDEIIAIAKAGNAYQPTVKNWNETHSTLEQKAATSGGKYDVPSTVKRQLRDTTTEGRETAPVFYSNLEIEAINPRRIRPLNDVTDVENYNYLVREFEESGWDGRPIVVVNAGDNGYYALTGSHRIHAAQEAGIDVEAVVIEDSEDIAELLDASDDEDRSRIARKLAEDGVIPEEIAELIAREDVLNFRNYGVKPEERTRFQLKGINKDGIEVYETSPAIMAMSHANRVKEYVNLMRNDFRGRTARFVRNGHTYYAKFDDNVNKIPYGEKDMSKKGKKALIRAGADGDIFDVVENANYKNSSVDTKNHKQKDGFTDYFDYFYKTVQIDDGVYDIIVNVKKQYYAQDGFTYTIKIQDNKTMKAFPARDTNVLSSRQGMPSSESNDTTPQTESQEESSNKRQIREPMEDYRTEIAADFRGKSKKDTREMLGEALETVAVNVKEEQLIEDYVREIDAINEAERKLSDINARLDELKTQQTEAMKEQGRRYASNEEIRRLEAQAKELADQITEHDRAILRMEATKTVKSLVRTYQNRVREARDKAILKQKMFATLTDLRKKLTDTSSTAYVPENLVEAAMAVLEVVDPGYKQGSKVREKYDNMQGALMALRNAYDALRNDPDYNFKSEYDEDVDYALQELIQLVKGKTIKNMSYSELESAYHIVYDINQMIRWAAKSLTDAENRTNAELGNKLIAEQREYAEKGLVRRTKKGKLTPLGKLTEIERNWTLNPVRAMHEMGAYQPDSEMYKLADKMEEGLTKGANWKMNALKPFEQLRRSKANRKLFNDAVQKTKDFGLTDVDGKRIDVTPMQAMQMVLTWEREEANPITRHLENRIVIPDPKLMARGKYKEAAAAGRKMNPISQEVYASLMEQLTGENAENREWNQKFLDAAKNFFRVETTKAINETTMQVKHRPVATTLNYIPFEVYEYDIASKESNIKFDGTVSGSGSMKSVRPGANSMLVMRGLNGMITNSANEVSRIYGLLALERDIGKLLNYKQGAWVENPTSVRDAVNTVWGKKGIDLVERAFSDVRYPRITNRSAIMEAVRNAFIASTLPGNIAVTIKQAASYLTAGSVIDPRALAKGMARYVAKASNPRARVQDVYDAIDKVTPLHWERRQGMQGIQELGDFAQSNGVLNKIDQKFGKASPMQWIQAVDVATTAALYYAAEEHAKLNGYKPGTEDFSEETKRVYEKALRETQPMYDPLHRAEITKTDDLRRIIMFQTQPLQNAGILYEAFNELRAQRKLHGAKSEEAKQATTKFMAAVGSQFASYIVFVGMTALGNALKHRMGGWKKDEDEEKPGAQTVIERYGYEMLQQIITNVFPIIGSMSTDVIETIMKWNGRDDLEVLEDNVIGKINDTVQNLAEAWKNPSLATIRSALIDIGTYLGVPSENVYKLITGVEAHIQDMANGRLFNYEALSANPKGLLEPWLEEKFADAKVRAIYDAIESGDPKKIKKVREDYKNSDGFTTAVAEALVEHDVRIEKAAAAKVNEDAQSFKDIVEQIVGEGSFTQAEVEKAVKLIEKRYNELAAGAAASLALKDNLGHDSAYAEMQDMGLDDEHVDELIDKAKKQLREDTLEDLAQQAADAMLVNDRKAETEARNELKKAGYTDEEISDAIEAAKRNPGEFDAAALLNNDEQTVVLSNAYISGDRDTIEEAEAMWTSEDSLKKARTGAIKLAYLSGKVTEDEAMKMLTTYADKSAKKAWADYIQKWDYIAANGTDEGFSVMKRFTDAAQTKANYNAIAKEYLQYYEKGDLAKALASIYKPIYIESDYYGKEALLKEIIPLYVTLGYTADYERRYIVKNWK